MVKKRTKLETLLWLITVLWFAEFCINQCSAHEPQIVVQRGHYGPAISVVFSPSGEIIASGGMDSTIVLWNTSTGRELRSLLGHSNSVTSLAFSPSGKTIASASHDKTIRIWDVASGKQLSSIAADAESIAFSPNGKMLASGGVRDTIKIWEVATGKELINVSGHNAERPNPAFDSFIRTLDPTSVSDHSTQQLRTLSNLAKTDCVRTVAFSPDGGLLISGNDDKTIKCWDVTTGKIARTFVGHSDSVNSVAFSPDGKRVASASSDKTLRLWDLVTGLEVRSFRGHSDEVTSVVFSQNGRTLISGSNDNTVKFWSVDTGNQICTLGGKTWIKSVSLSKDRHTLASASNDGTVSLWNTETRRTLRLLKGHSHPIGQLAFSPDGRTIACCHSDKTIKLWDISASKEPRVLDDAQSGTHAIEFSPDGLTLGSADHDNKVRLWDVSSGKVIRSFVGHCSTIWTIAFSPNGKVLASGSKDKTIKLWDIETGKVLRTFSGYSAWRTVAFSPDGKLLAAGSLLARGDNDTVKVWDVTSGSELQTLKGHRSVTKVAFNPKGTVLASIGGGTSRLWDVASGKQLSVLTTSAPYENFSLAFSSDGKILAMGNDNNTIKLWSVDLGKEIRSLNSDAKVSCVAFSPDGKTLASCGNEDNTCDLWDVQSGQHLLSFCAVDKTDWTVVTQKGYFDASNLEEVSAVSWVLPDEPLKALPPEIFMRQYFQPNLLSRLMNRERLPNLKSIAELNRVQPDVTISTVSAHKDFNDLIDVTVTWQSVAAYQPTKGKVISGVYDLRLFRDGQLVGYLPENASFSSNAPMDLSHGSLNQFSHKFTVKLPHDGSTEHEFTAYAFNSDKVKSRTANFEYKLPSPLERKKGNAYVIAFGVDVYDDPRWKLRYAAADARAFQDELAPAMRSTGDYSKVISIELVSADDKRNNELPATKECLRDVLLALSGHPSPNFATAKLLRQKGVTKTEPEDFVLIAFSCHGATNKNNGSFYLFPVNIGANQSSGLTPELENFGISSEELTDWLRDVDASDMTMVIDACHSGAASGKDFKPGPMDSPGLGQLAYYKRMRLLTASQAASTAQEVSTLGHGLLTFALLNSALAKDGRADTAPKDNKIQLNEWLQFARDEVPRLDLGNFTKRSVNDALSTTRDMTLMNKYKSGTKSEPQTPSLLDFSKKAKDISILDLKAR